MRMRLPSIGDRVYDTGSRQSGVVTKVRDDVIEMQFDEPWRPDGYPNDSPIEHTVLWRFRQSLVVLESGAAA